ncbi:hypothetical protein WJX81_005058 [Elliptochloris bilobata]|uniref:Fatty acyl-CoA reductase n=1 Tax=Elliptochloris bilobata TaxID=381761 RepID=A0AAW1QC05_9CHLO
MTPAARLAALLRGPVFHLLRARVTDVAARIGVIEADIEQPGFGLSEEQRAELASDVDYIIHCAASIRFDLPVKAVLRANFTPTRALLDFASTLPHLRAFTFMSTAYANAHLPQGSFIEEKIYPLVLPPPPRPAASLASGCLGGGRIAEGRSGADSDADSEPGTPGGSLGGAAGGAAAAGVEIDGLALAEALLAAAPEDAEREAQRIMKATGIQNTYFLIKNLMERMVMTYAGNRLRLCIVRPTIVTGVQGAPYPGYVGNTSGLTGCYLATALGIVRFAQHDPKSVVAIVPGDMVSSVTLAATVATAEGCPEVGPIVQVCTSTTHPAHSRILHSITCNYLNAKPPSSLGRHARSNYQVDFVKGDAAFNARCLAHSVRVGSMCAMLRLAREGKAANKLMTGWGVWRELGSRRADYNLRFATGGIQALQAALGPAEAAHFKCLFSADLGDDWTRYLQTCAAGINYLYLREPLATASNAGFVPVTDAPGLEVFPAVKTAAAPVHIVAQDAAASNASSIQVADAVEKAVGVVEAVQKAVGVAA